MPGTGSTRRRCPIVGAGFRCVDRPLGGILCGGPPPSTLTRVQYVFGLLNIVRTGCYLI